MSKVLNELPASASNNESLILQALNASNQRQVAEMINVDASILSRMKTEKKSNGWTEIEFISFLLTAIGLKVVQESDIFQGFSTPFGYWRAVSQIGYHFTCELTKA